MNKKYYEIIGEEIKIARRKKHMTQQEVADKIGKERAAYAQYERGASAISMDTWGKICKVLDINSSAMMKKAEELSN